MKDLLRTCCSIKLTNHLSIYHFSIELHGPCLDVIFVDVQMHIAQKMNQLKFIK